jgi:hypothetical protein
MWPSLCHLWASTRGLAQGFCSPAMFFLQHVIEQKQVAPTAGQQPAQPAKRGAMAQLVRQGSTKALQLVGPCASSKNAGPRKTLAALNLPGPLLPASAWGLYDFVLDLEGMSEVDRCIVLENARITAILGTCTRTLRSLRSGLACWVGFVGVCACVASICAHVGLRLCLPDDAFPNVSARDGRKYFPPTVPMLLAWSMGFRVRATFVN